MALGQYWSKVIVSIKIPPIIHTNSYTYKRKSFAMVLDTFGSKRKA